MRLFIALTDSEWLAQLGYLSAQGGVEEVNFWRSSNLGFNALQPGEMLLFKRHAPASTLAGGGFFARAAHYPLYLAWEAFGLANGARSEAAMAARIAHYRRDGRAAPSEPITCIVLSEPFFFPPDEEIPAPASFSRHTQVGRLYRGDEADGRALFHAVRERLARAHVVDPGPALFNVRQTPSYGAARPVLPRLGQGGFRISITEAYRRRCAMTGERTLPALEAAHIRPYSDGGGHQLRNGLLLRRDLHRLFDLGYLTVRPADSIIQVSRRIRTEFENGRHYYQLDGQPVALPADPAARPDPDCLRYHAEHVFR